MPLLCFTRKKYSYGFDVDENEELAFEYAFAPNSEEPQGVTGNGARPRHRTNHAKAVYWLN